jgi:N-acyl-D-aspartate/D-glutamate deacylase
VIAYCFRFNNNARDPKSKKYGSLTVDETEEALLRCFRKNQELSYSDELKDLRVGGPIRKHSKLLALHPFLDKDGLIRVGGRLQAAVLDYDKKTSRNIATQRPSI